MKKLGLFLSLLLCIPFAMGDVTPATGTKNVWNHQNLNRTNLYKPRSIFLADPANYTLELKAPTLSDDNTKFVLPATNGASGNYLKTDGAGNLSWDASLTDLAALSKADSNIIVGDGTHWVAESGTTARTSLGLGINDSPQFNALSITTNLTLINQGLAKFNEATGNGTNYVSIQAPASLATDYTLTLPAKTDTIATLSDVVGTVVGSVTMFAGAAAPTGWMLCDGGEYSRSTYSALFAVIGTTWGAGDGSTTFNVPDFRGVFPKGAGTQSSYTFTISSGSATKGAVYGNNGSFFFVLNTISGGTVLYTQGNGAPQSSGTLSKTSGTGDSNLTFSAVDAVSYSATSGTYYRDKVQGHKHAVDHDHSAKTSSGQSQSHTHSGTTSTESTSTGTSIFLQSSSNNGNLVAGSNVGVNTGTHTHTITTGNASQDHTHSVDLDAYTGDSGVVKTDGSNGTPRTSITTEPQSVGINFIIKY